MTGLSSSCDFDTSRAVVLLASGSSHEICMVWGRESQLSRDERKQAFRAELSCENNFGLGDEEQFLCPCELT